MADHAVYDAIKAHLSDPDVLATLTDPDSHATPPIRFENEGFKQPNPPAPWISMALTGSVYGRVSIGAAQMSDNRWDESGDVWLDVLVPAGEGGSRARRLAKRLADVFRGLTLLDGTLEFYDAHVGSGGAAAEEKGNWFKLELAIEWRHVEA